MTSLIRKYALVLVGLVVIIFVLIRWNSLGRDFSSFVMLTENRTIDKVFNRPFAFQNSGYDGISFYSYAQDPMAIPQPITDPKSGKTVYHIEGVVQSSNYTFRKKRIGYPYASWLISGLGQKNAIPLTLVIVNILAFIGLFFFVSQLGPTFNWSSVWALLLLTFVGSYLCVARDLADLMAVTLSIGALYFILKNALLPSILFGVAAILTKESVLFLVAIPYAWHLLISDKKTWRFLVRLALLSLPFAFYCGWLYYLKIESFAIEGYRSTAVNFTWPFFGMIKGLFLSGNTTSSVLASLLTLSIFSLATEALRSLKKANFKRMDRTFMLTAMLLIYLLVSVSFSHKIYEDFWSIGRNLLPLQLIAFLVTLHAKGRISNFNIGLSTLIGLAYISLLVVFP